MLIITLPVFISGAMIFGHAIYRTYSDRHNISSCQIYKTMKLTSIGHALLVVAGVLAVVDMVLSALSLF